MSRKFTENRSEFAAKTEVEIVSENSGRIGVNLRRRPKIKSHEKIYGELKGDLEFFVQEEQKEGVFGLRIICPKSKREKGELGLE